MGTRMQSPVSSHEHDWETRAFVQLLHAETRAWRPLSVLGEIELVDGGKTKVVDPKVGGCSAEVRRMFKFVCSRV